jgi:hypothetical protein
MTNPVAFITDEQLVPHLAWFIHNAYDDVVARYPDDAEGDYARAVVKLSLSHAVQEWLLRVSHRRYSAGVIHAVLFAHPAWTVPGWEKKLLRLIRAES